MYRRPLAWWGEYRFEGCDPGVASGTGSGDYNIIKKWEAISYASRGTLYYLAGKIADYKGR